jgi:hypothetical protein
MSEQGAWIMWADPERGTQPLGTILSSDDDTITYQPRFGQPITVKRAEVRIR